MIGLEKLGLTLENQSKERRVITVLNAINFYQKTPKDEVDNGFL